MSKIEKLADQARAHLEAGENVLAAILGTYETKIFGNDSTRSGVMLATDQRIVLYAKKLGGYDLESFSYDNISSFEQSKSMMGHQLSFFASGNKVNLKWISDRSAFERFAQVFKSRLNNRPSSAQGDTTTVDPAPTSPSDTVFDQLHQLGQLRDAGIVTPAEFESKKAELLGRL